MSAEDSFWSRLREQLKAGQAVTPSAPMRIEQPTPSGWRCYLFGATDASGMVWHPNEGQLPNAFQRWVMGWALGCRWVKGPKR